MPTAVIPTLHNGTGIIKKKENILAYLLRHVASCPGSTSVHYEDELVSLRKHMAQYGHDPEVLASTFAADVQQVIQRHYDDATVSVECAASAVVDNTYTLDVKVLAVSTTGKMEPAISHGKIYITDNRQIKIKFDE